MKKEPKVLDFDEFADELLAEKQPRALVILAAAKIDIQLRLLIETVFLPKCAKAADEDELLDGNSPLATFSSRIKVCRRLGLLDHRVWKVIDQLRDIRNHAAHWISFEIAQSPRDLLRNLQSIVEEWESYKLTVKRFFPDSELNKYELLKATLLTLCVLIESIQCATAKEQCVSKATFISK